MNPILSKTVSLHPRVRHRQVGDEAVLVCMHSGNVLVVNQVGAHIVSDLDQASTVVNLIESVCDEFDVSNAQAQTDLIEYLQELDQQDVIVLHDSESRS